MTRERAAAVLTLLVLVSVLALLIARQRRPAGRLPGPDVTLTPTHRAVLEALAKLEAAERRANDLADALRDFEGAVRVYDVMLNEPAAEGLMSAEDYSAYLRGAWLGVEEAAVVARAALVEHRSLSPGGRLQWRITQAGRDAL
jgi:hypothetical protein